MHVPPQLADYLQSPARVFEQPQHGRYFRVCLPGELSTSFDGKTLKHNVEQKQRSPRPSLPPAGFEWVPWLRPDLLAFQVQSSGESAREVAQKLAPLKIVGIDAASLACVAALNLRSEDTVLDLCAAPGGKSMAMAEFVRRVVAVDLSRDRLFVMQSLLQRFGYKNVMLIEADGRRFDPRDTTTFIYHARRARQRRKVRLPTPLPGCYDKVLVDAECTHDGSLKHMTRHPNDEQALAKVMEPIRLRGLPQLQLELLAAGWRLLDKTKATARLIYSTCSFSALQNEDIVERFLRSPEGSEAELETIEFLRSTPCAEVAISDLGVGYIFGKDVSVTGVLRNTVTGGLFLARLRVRRSARDPATTGMYN